MKKYDPAIVTQAKAVLVKMRALFPGAVELVYDNYNALVIGFGASEHASECPCSIALYPKWVTLFFLQGVDLPDPKKLLQGTGKRVRSIRLTEPEILDAIDVRKLVTAALKRAPQPWDPTRPARMVIQSVSAKQRPRRS